MSIAAMKRVIVAGDADRREAVLSALQDLGAVHLQPLDPEGLAALEATDEAGDAGSVGAMRNSTSTPSSTRCAKTRGASMRWRIGAIFC